MRIYIVIPAHNEDQHIAKTMESLVQQQLKPAQLVVVNDHSSDDTLKIANEYAQKYSWIKVVEKKSTDEHLPGAKVIEAFYKGYETMNEHFDVLCKFDADLIFEKDYLFKIAEHFQSDSSLGMVAGTCYIQQENQWVEENLNQRDHIRGALKAYRKECFAEIGKIKKSIGWDTLDELLAKYHGWKTLVDPSLKVKHLKPTGYYYSPGTAILQGVATYKMRLGIVLTLLIGAKRAWVKQNPKILMSYLRGFWQAQKEGVDFMVDSDQGKFLRRHRWKGILRRFK